jgi:hypothetical protein
MAATLAVLVRNKSELQSRRAPCGGELSGHPISGSRVVEKLSKNLFSIRAETTVPADRELGCLRVRDARGCDDSLAVRMDEPHWWRHSTKQCSWNYPG